MQKTIFLYLIIFTAFSAELFCQNLKLEIKGNSSIETQTIDSLRYINNHINYLSITNEVDALQKELYQLGYIENELKSIQQINDSVFSAEIHLKKKYHHISLYYDASQINPKLLNTISENIFDTHFIIPFSTLENTLTLINTKMAENGFPFTKLNLSNIEMDPDHQLKAKIKITQTEKKRFINDILIKGYEKFPRSYLKHYLKIKRNQIFNIDIIKEKTQQLNNLKFASELKTPEILFSKDSTTLYLYLEKTKSNAFDGFLGFGNNDNTNKIQFNGYLNLSLTNNLNYGESFKLLYKSDESDQKMFETHASLPYLLKSPIGLDLTLRIFKRDSSFSTVNQNAKIHYQINSKHKIYSGISSTQSSNLLNEFTNSNILDYKTNLYTFAYEFLKMQAYNLLFPVHSQVYMETSFGKRRQSNEQEKQSLMNVDGFKIINLDIKNSLYLRAQGTVLNSKTHFENELIRFGGINSIRGFEENSIYATTIGLLNTEYRFQLNNAMYLHTITDIAYFENKIANTEEKLLGMGFGFGILTKTGLLKFNYANGKNEKNSFKLSNSKIHLSFIANF